MRHVIRVLKTPVTLVLLLAFVGYGAYWGYQNVRAPIPARAPDPCVMVDVGKTLTPERVGLRVYNGSARGGLAKTTSTYLRALGFVINKVNNTEEEITTTVIVGPTKDDPQVALLLQLFPKAEVRADGRTDGYIDVMVGAEYSTPKNPPKLAVAVDGPVCLSPMTAKLTSTPSPSPSR